MATIYMDNLVIADTLTVVGQTSTSETIGTLTVTTSMVSAAGKIGLGTNPGTTGAINVDGATYSGIVAVFTNSTATSRITQATNLLRIGPTSNHALYLASNNVDQWAVDGSVASTSILKSLQAAGQVWGGPTSMTFYQSNGTTVALQYTANGQTGIGAAINAASFLYVAGSVTASAGAAVGLRLDSTLVAAVNADSMRSLRIAPTFTPGAFTSLVATGIEIAAFSVAGFTTPGNPVGINVGIITGTGAPVATALQLAPPTGATTNYLIAHTTAATFNVTGGGQITAALAFLGSSDIRAGAANAFYWTGRSVLTSTADGIVNAFATNGTTYATVNALTFAGLKGTAVPATAGAVAAGIPFQMYSSSVTIEVTSDAPTHTRPKGSLCINTGGTTTATRIYINTDGAGTWTNLTSGA